MKIEHLLAHFLYRNSQLSLAGLGYFYLDREAFDTLYAPQEPIEASVLDFRQDPTAPQDQTLIDFIVAQTGKMRSLATSDLASFLLSGQQLTNIHLDFTLEGIGSLHQDLKGKLIFKPGTYLPPQGEEGQKKYRGSTVRNRIRKEKGVLLNQAFKPHSRPWWIASLLLLILVTGAWWSQHYGKDHKPENRNLIEASLISASLDYARNSNRDQDQHLDLGIHSANHQLSYNIVFEIADSIRAFERFRQLTSWGDRVILYTRDSIRFFLAAPFSTPVEDTGAMKDSISNFFGRSVFLDEIRLN